MNRSPVMVGIRSQRPLGKFLSLATGRYTQRLADNEQRSETYWPRVLAKLDKIAEEQASEKGTRGEQPEAPGYMKIRDFSLVFH